MATMADTKTGDKPLSFLSTLTDSPHRFLQPSIPLYTDTLAYLKNILDPIAADVSSIQSQRRQEARKKRKRGSRIPEEEVLRLKQIHVEGFTVEQIWEQSRRVIEAVVGEAERGLENVGEDVLGEFEEDKGSSLGEEGVGYEVEGPDMDGEEWEDEISEQDGYDDINALEDEEDIEMSDDDNFDDHPQNTAPAEEFVPDKFGLNDGFFSIDDFNRNSEFLEQQDVMGEDDGAASDEEDLNWDADPLAQSAKGTNNDNAANGFEDDDEDEDEDGPTFGDPDAPSEDEEDELLNSGDMEGMADGTNTNHIMYADFFAPPAQKKKKNKKGRPNPHNFPEKTASGKKEVDKAEEQADMERTMAAVHRDLFEDEDSASESDDANIQSRNTNGRVESNRSTHEKRRIALANEIRQLEAANVAKRPWTLSGEAQASDRPLNSLLEESLEFERAGKPVPVITAEVSESIEDLIKRRILAHDFQDIPRRRPGDLVTGKDARRGKQDYVLDDERSKKGLAEEYEEEHLRLTDPNYVDAQDAKTKKEQDEILQIWKKISSDLDGLSSWHFRPKAPAPQLSILVDAPAIAVEDARPSAGGEVAGASQLAPQEVYSAKQEKGTGDEIVGKSGLPSAREEVGREERKRARRREKERGKKATGNNAVDPTAKKTGNWKGRGGEERKRLMGDLKKGGVGVIGKKGEVTDVLGKEVRSAEQVQGGGGGGRFKL